jgi:hypothetical protein
MERVIEEVVNKTKIKVIIRNSPSKEAISNYVRTFVSLCNSGDIILKKEK